MPHSHGGAQTPRTRALTPPTSLGHRPALDGLRGVAFLAVFAGHAQLLVGATPGSTAMFVFFALSGFLITALAIDEVAAHGALDLKAFFQRRARRLLPALALFLSLWLLVDALFGHDPWMTTVPGGGRGGPKPFATAIEGVLAAAVYVLNWAVIEHAFTHYLAIAHLWSLSVEEQFYLAWAPLVALVLPRRRWLLVATGLFLAVASLAEVPLLWHHGHGSLRIYMGTDTRAAAFLLGGVAAVAWSYGDSRLLARRRSASVVFGLSAGLLLWVASPLAAPGSPLVPASALAAYLLTWIIATMASVGVVVASASLTTQLPARALGSAPLRYVGTRSYALYLWHYPWLTWLRGDGTLGILLALVLSFACAELSRRLVESSALHWIRIDRSRASHVPKHPARASTPPRTDLIVSSTPRPPGSS